jgi:hypothetical protein
MDYAALRAEIDNDPAGLGLAAMTPEQIQAALTTNTVATTRHVPLDELQAMLMSTVSDGSPVPAWWVIKGAAAANPVAEMAFDLFSSRLKALDTTLPTVQGLLAQLVATGVLTQALADTVVGMAATNIPRGVALFGRVPNVLEIQLAMLEG